LPALRICIVDVPCSPDPFRPAEGAAGTLGRPGHTRTGPSRPGAVTAGEPLRKLLDGYGDHMRVLDPGDRFEIGPPISDSWLKGLPRFNGTLRGVGEAATIVTLRAGVPCDGRGLAPGGREQP
jgi:hypothetical protein